MGTALKAALTWAARFLQDRNEPSSTRLIMLLGILVPLAVWTGLSIYKLALQPMPESMLVFEGMCLGLKGVDKALSTRLGVAVAEKDKPEPTEPTVIQPAVKIDVKGE